MAEKSLFKEDTCSVCELKVLRGNDGTGHENVLFNTLPFLSGQMIVVRHEHQPYD